jgi:protein-tyrosine-phosphatase
MERATVADELLLSAQSQEVKDAMQRIYGDPKLTDPYQQGFDSALHQARRNIRDWFKNRGTGDPMDQDDIDKLVAIIDT